MLYKSARERKRRLRKLCKDTAKAKRLSVAGAWFNDKKNRYEKFAYHTDGLKAICTRATRRRLKRQLTRNPEDAIAGRGAHYRKEFDYWWTLI